MKHVNKIFLVNLIPVIVSLLFAAFMFFYLNGGLEELFSVFGFTNDLSGENPGDGYALVGGLALGGLAALGVMVGILIFVIVPVFIACYMLFFLIIGRLCMVGEKTKIKLNLFKIFTCIANLANVIVVLFSIYQMIIQFVEIGFNGFLYMIPILIFVLPLIYTIKQFFFFKNI